MKDREAGNLMVVIPIALVLAVGLVTATLTLSTDNVRDALRETRRIQAYYSAKAGLEQQIFDLKQMTRTAVLVDPFAAVESYHDKRTYSDSRKLQPNPAPPFQTIATDASGEFIDARALLAENGVQSSGTFDVSLRIEGFDPLNPGALSDSRRFVTIRSTGWSPSRTSPDAVSYTIESTVLLELSSSEVFDYAYFINNWGWFYGNTIEANGNVRSNGQFSSVGYTPTVNGSPRYLGANGTDLYGYLDDNEDGVRDGSDGGVYAGWGIDGGTGLQGMAGTQVAGEYVNQHGNDGKVDMPNLTDLALYEQHAIETNSSITIGGSQVCDAVCGDEVGEKQNLILIGTASNPITLNGTIVVRGNLIIKGKVQGQGVIYAGGDVYVADDIEYVNPPSSERPAGASEAEFEAWLQTNQDADALGLFAREHIVLGSPTHSYFTNYVASWVSHPLNKSVEDAGMDGIPNTRAGRDGILNTDDDDYLEADGQWTVDHYTPVHALLGLIPPGSVVGDVIPGSGEDIDGDGQFDPAVAMSEFALSGKVNATGWQGSVPGGTGKTISELSTITIAKIDAALYTNHTIAGVMVSWGSDIKVNGCVVSRNEAIVYGGNKLQINHDSRLIGGGENFGYYLPRTFRAIRVMKNEVDVAPVHFDEIGFYSDPELVELLAAALAGGAGGTGGTGGGGLLGGILGTVGGIVGGVTGGNDDDD